jgi:hypothetical protein
MNDPKRLVILMWFVAIGLIGAREIRATRTLPAPAGMVSASIVYSILGLVSEFAAPFAAALAVGYAIALLMVPGILPQVATAPTLPNSGGTPLPGTNAVPGAPKPGFTP